MFIDVTRFGGTRRQRLAVAAIAYLDEAPDGCAIRLIGGESLRVSEDPATVERRVDASLGLQPVLSFIDPDLEEAAVTVRDSAELMPTVDAVENRVETARSRRRGKQA